MAPDKRMKADDRRRLILDAAIEEYGRSGMHEVSTEAIAERAGVSQPYLFRLFGSKKELYVATVRRCFRRTLEAMQEAAEGLRGEEALDAMGTAYGELLRTDPAMLQGQLQTYAAALDDPDVRDAVREGYGDLYTYVERVAGVSQARLARFFAMGMLFNVVAAMGFHEESDPEPWAARLMAGCSDPDGA